MDKIDNFDYFNKQNPKIILVCEKCISCVWAVFLEVSSVLFAMLLFRTNRRQLVRKTEAKMSEITKWSEMSP